MPSSHGDVPSWPAGPHGLRIAIATASDRDQIYRIRHDVYAVELGQHHEDATGRLTDALDPINEYVAASIGSRVVGFVSITPPDHDRYSIDKYVARSELPFALDDGTFEIRILTVIERLRGSPIAAILMYAALRLVESRGGTRIILIGRTELVDVYRRAGMELLGRTVRSGAVSFELMSATVEAARARVAHYAPALRRLAPLLDWRLDVPFELAPVLAHHGGASIEALGARMGSVARRRQIVSADVLDAWYPAAPGVVAAVGTDLAWVIGTSPPSRADGLIRAIAEARGLDPGCIVLGSGLSSLIFLAFSRWLTASSRVLIADPMYGEYQFVLESLIGCRVERLRLEPSDGFALEPSRLASALEKEFDMAILVNPNNPTGTHVHPDDLASVIRAAPSRTKIWIDETYVDFAAPDASLERLIPSVTNLVIGKSMSKAYALSGLRVAYLGAAPPVVEDLRRHSPPWAVSMPGVIGAIEALRAPAYYADRHAETRRLRDGLTQALCTIPGAAPVPSAANFVLCRLPPDGPTSATVLERCRMSDVYLRDFPDHPVLTDYVRIAVKEPATTDLIQATLRRAVAGYGRSDP
jgi:histidinol-phosphate/aromatic aminotransferase/cobyric acid decarboxylase-like protein